jgi:hypothetical protein
MDSHEIQGCRLLYRLFQERQALGHAARTGVGQTEGSGDPGEAEREVPSSAKLQARSERANYLVAVPPQEVRPGDAPTRVGDRVVVISCLRNAKPVFSRRDRSAEFAEIGESHGYPRSTIRRGNDRQTEPLTDQFALERLNRLLQNVDGPAILP